MPVLLARPSVATVGGSHSRWHSGWLDARLAWLTQLLNIGKLIYIHPQSTIHPLHPAPLLLAPLAPTMSAEKNQYPVPIMNISISP